jgi:hypothetical protein
MSAEEGEPLVESPVREITVQGTGWTASVEGRARVRAGGGAGAPLLLVVFRAEGRDPLEALVVGRRLEELPEERLVDALAAARPHRPDADPPPFFEGTRPRSSPHA